MVMTMENPEIITSKLEALYTSQALVAHTCNPSYLRGCDQDDHSPG
jgi:hypothetical protein